MRRDKIITFVRVVEKDGRTTDIRMRSRRIARYFCFIANDSRRYRCAFVLPDIRI